MLVFGSIERFSDAIERARVVLTRSLHPLSHKLFGTSIVSHGDFIQALFEWIRWRVVADVFPRRVNVLYAKTPTHWRITTAYKNVIHGG